MKFFLCVIGMVMVVEGFPYFAFPDKMKNIMSMISELPDRFLRIFGMMLLAIGLFLVYITKNMG